MELINEDLLFKMEEDEGEENNNEEYNKNNPRRTGRAYRRKTEKIKNRRLKNIILSGGYYPERGIISDYNNINHAYIKDCSRAGCKKFLKKMATRKTRRNPSLSHCGYKKEFDLWWILH